MKLLTSLAKGCSITGGLIITALMLMTCYSVVGRNFFSSPLIGDFELTGIACGISMAFFMPLCQLERGNIIVDFFTANRSVRFNQRLDRFGDLLMTVIFFLLSWRTGVAALSAKENQGASMLLGFPDWIVLASMSVPLGLAALVALNQALGRIKSEQQGAS